MLGGRRLGREEGGSTAERSTTFAKKNSPWKGQYCRGNGGKKRKTSCCGVEGGGTH